MRRPLVSLALLLGLGLVVAPRPARANPLLAVGILEDLPMFVRGKEKRRRERELRLARELLASALAGVQRPDTRGRQESYGSLVALTRKHADGSFVLPDPAAVALVFQAGLRDPDWKVRWHCCQGLVGLGYRPEDVQRALATVAR